MATAVEVVVDTGGTGDYATLAAAEAGEQRNLVTADEQLTIKCQCTTGVADNSPFAFAGWTVDATRYIKVWTDPAEGYRHTGKWDDSKYRNVNIQSYDHLDFGQVRIAEGLQLYQSAYNGLVGAALISFDSCIVKGCLRPVGGGTISNCLFLYSGYNTKGIDNNWRGSQYTYNCTFVGIALGMSIVTGNNACTTKNCLFYDCAADYYQSVSTSKTQTNCATDNDSAASGLSSAESTHRFEQTFGFVNSGSGDYHLTSSDGGAKGYGTNLYATFTTDIDGQARPSSGAWCIGADEYIAAGGGTDVDLAASMLAEAAISPLLEISRAVSASMTAMTSILASLTTDAVSYVDLIASIASTAGASAALSVTRDMAAQVAATSGIVAGLARTAGLSTQLAAATDIDATLDRQPGLSTSLGGATAASGALDRQPGMGTSIGATSSISGALAVLRGMQTSMDAITRILAHFILGTVVSEEDIILGAPLQRQVEMLSALQAEVERFSELTRQLTMYVQLTE